MASLLPSDMLPQSSNPASGSPSVQTYIPLYRKYRPQQFDEVVGQTAVIQTLKNAVVSGQVAHAYLLCGPRGTGKTSTARILAKSLNCLTHGPTATPCHTCESCTGITHGTGLDVVEIDAASNNSVNDVRELIDTCQFTPMQGGYKIYIIDEVHMLSTQAFNALLKTLEEPPPNVVFIFATTEAHKVLPTIISRCQRFDFSRIRLPELVNHLRTVADSEGIHIDEDGLAMVARHAKGGLRDALGMLDQVGVLSHAQPGTVITAEDVTRFLGSVAEETLIELLTAIAEQAPDTLLRLLDGLQQNGMEPRVLVQALMEAVRNLMITHACANDSPETTRTLLGVNDSLFEKLVTLAQQFKAEEYPQLLGKLNELDRQLRQSQTPQLWLETGLLSLTYRHEMATIADLRQRIEALEAGTTNPPVAASAPKQPTQTTPPQAVTPNPPSQPVPPPPVTPATPQPQPQATMAPPQPAPAIPAPMPEPLPAPSTPTPVASTPSSAGAINWSAVVQAIASIPTKAMVQQHAHFIGIEGNIVVVGCSSQGILNTLKVPSKLIHLNKAVEAVTGQALEVRLEVGATPSIGNIPPAPIPTPAPAAPVLPPPVAPQPVPSVPAMPSATPAPSMGATPPQPQAMASPALTPSSSEGPVTPPADAPPKRPALVLDDIPITMPAPPPAAQPAVTPPQQAPSTEVADSTFAPISPTDFSADDIAEAKQHVATLLQGKEL